MPVSDRLEALRERLSGRQQALKGARGAVDVAMAKQSVEAAQTQVDEADEDIRVLAYLRRRAGGARTVVVYRDEGARDLGVTPDEFAHALNRLADDDDIDKTMVGAAHRQRYDIALL